MRDHTQKTFSSDAQRWKAVQTRDQRADGVFFYAVKTTGVYCRPICPSRLPQSENVVFFMSGTEAEESGFRPCKRCSPDAASPREYHLKRVLRACRLIEESEVHPGLEDLAAVVGMSSSRFHRLFKEIVGVTPKEYASMLRMGRLKSSLMKGASITDAIYDAGFNSSSRFYEKSAGMLGMTATGYKNGAAGVKMRVALAESYLGWVLVAATDHGICSIELGDTPAALTKCLRVRFPKAELYEEDLEFTDWVSRVTAFVEAPECGLDLPLDIQGTAFQRRVWKALQEIPLGSTRSYSDIAKQIGNSGAARAVARACASNRIAVAVPCHRAVRSNGDLCGYRWGIERKQAILERENSKSKGTKV